MGFSRQEHWSVLPCPPPGDLPHQGSNPLLLHCRQILHCWATGEMRVCSPCGCSPCVCVWSWYMCVCIHYIYICVYISERHTFFVPYKMGFPSGSDGKEYACNAGDLGSIPVSGRPPGDGNDYPLQNSCLEDPTDRGAHWAPLLLHGVAKSQRQLSDQHVHLQDEATSLKPGISSFLGYIRVFLLLLFYYLLSPTNSTELPFLSSSLT